MSNEEINRQKRDDLMAVYRQVYHKCWRQRDAYRRTVQHAAPRFYVTPKQAYQRLLPMLDGDFSVIENMSPLKKKMYMDLFDIVLETAERREFLGKSLWFIIPWVVTQPAPEFYTTEERFKQIFHEVKGWKRKPRQWNGTLKRWEPTPDPSQE
jgi:hypothetical protein